jgi:hypothetical protein
MFVTFCRGQTSAMEAVLNYGRAAAPKSAYWGSGSGRVVRRASGEYVKHLGGPGDRDGSDSLCEVCWYPLLPGMFAYLTRRQMLPEKKILSVLFSPGAVGMLCLNAQCCC